MRDEIDKLANLFLEFPGIGERQSRRFVYSLLSKNKEYLSQLSDAIKNLRQKIATCTYCFRHYPADGHDLCPECSSTSTNKTQLMILENDASFETLRRSKLYKGRYFVLGGLVPVVEKSTDKLIRINELVSRVESQIKEGLKEIIIGLSLTPQGENTDRYVREKLDQLVQKHDLGISSLGRGLSTGSELEYSDDDTIKNALAGRK